MSVTFHLADSREGIVVESIYVNGVTIHLSYPEKLLAWELKRLAEAQDVYLQVQED